MFRRFFRRCSKVSIHLLRTDAPYLVCNRTDNTHNRCHFLVYLDVGRFHWNSQKRLRSLVAFFRAWISARREALRNGRFVDFSSFACSLPAGSTAIESTVARFTIETLRKLQLGFIDRPNRLEIPDLCQRRFVSVFDSTRDRVTQRCRHRVSQSSQLIRATLAGEHFGTSWIGKQSRGIENGYSTRCTSSSSLVTFTWQSWEQMHFLSAYSYSYSFIVPEIAYSFAFAARDDISTNRFFSLFRVLRVQNLDNLCKSNASEWIPGVTV